MSHLHVTESAADRRKNKELAEARASGAVAPAVDVKTGSMINPHNPEFITKRPWYLGGADAGPSLDHQADQRPDKEKMEVSLADADNFLRNERRKRKQLLRKGEFQVGMWIEALKNNKLPYRICQIIKIAKKGTEFDLQYEDGCIERKVKNNKKFGSAGKPRLRMTKVGARSTAMDVDKYGKESFDSKRDQYHGYELDTHNTKVEQRFSERDDIRKVIRQKEKELAEKKNQNNTGGVNGAGDDDDGGIGKNKSNHVESDSDLDSDVEDDDDSDDEFVQRDEDAKVITSRLARQGGVGGAQMKVTARNLRIREDTAKYLRNLDPNSAYYDPKSRSMRDNPNPEIAPEESQFAGDNFTRISGDAVGLADTQLFAWEASDKGVKELHPQANPSQAELLKKQFKSKSESLDVQRKKAVLDKYGGEEYLDGADGLATAVDGSARQQAKEAAQERQTRFGVSTAQEEYRPDGSLAKDSGNIKRVALKSKYEEDIFINGHWTVWGSYFHKGAFQWGYADDHSLLKNSYCTGENGRKANDDANAMRYGTGEAGSAALAQAREMLKAVPASQRPSGSAGGAGYKPNSSRLYGEADQKAKLDEEKLKEALKNVEKGKKELKDDRKRKYNSLNAEHYDVTEEDMEAYRLSKETKSDPMANIGSDEVLEYKK